MYVRKEKKKPAMWKNRRGRMDIMVIYVNRDMTNFVDRKSFRGARVC
jgi:hypothetical protein